MNNVPFAVSPGPIASPALSVTFNNPATVLAKAALLERLADLHQNEGRGWHADRLSHLAFEMRCRVLGVRA